MTEQEWQWFEEPSAMLRLMAAQGVGERKFLLFAVACCQRIWSCLDEHCQQAIALLERHADGEAVDLALVRELTNAAERTQAHPWAAAAVKAALGEGKPHAQADLASLWTAHEASVHCTAKGGRLRPGGFSIEHQAHCDLLRDIFGNPFHIVTTDPRWLTLDVVALARGIYDSRAFDDMPILSDALLDAGCDNDAVIVHCHSPGRHVRGCWVLDLLLARHQPMCVHVQDVRVRGVSSPLFERDRYSAAEFVRNFDGAPVGRDGEKICVNFPITSDDGEEMSVYFPDCAADPPAELRQLARRVCASITELDNLVQDSCEDSWRSSENPGEDHRLTLVFITVATDRVWLQYYGTIVNTEWIAKFRPCADGSWIKVNF